MTLTTVAVTLMVVLLMLSLGLELRLQRLAQGLTDEHQLEFNKAASGYETPSIFGIALTKTCRKSSRPGRK